MYLRQYVKLNTVIDRNYMFIVENWEYIEKHVGEVKIALSAQT